MFCTNHRAKIILEADLHIEDTGCVCAVTFHELRGLFWPYLCVFLKKYFEAMADIHDESKY